MFRKIAQTNRVVKHRASVERALVPADAVVVGVPDPRIVSAAQAAVSGDLGPVSDLLAGTRRRGSWTLRSQAVEHLADQAVATPGWLAAWHEQSPEDPDLALVRAATAVTHAWDVRTTRPAEHVDRDQFDAFFSLLEDAHPLLAAAIQANPGDPVPWEWALTHARGSQRPPEVVEGCLGSMMAADPGHLRGLHQALLYVAPRWFGSEDALLSLADELTPARDDVSSPACLVPLVAVLELKTEGESRTWSSAPPERAVDAATRAEAWLAGPGRGHDLECWTRSALVWLYFVLRRVEDSYRHLQALGPRIESYPWRYFEDAEATFRHVRESVVVLVASERR